MIFCIAKVILKPVGRAVPKFCIAKNEGKKTFFTALGVPRQGQQTGKSSPVHPRDGQPRPALHSPKAYWPVEFYDFTQHQLILNQEIGKCHEIFVHFRLRDLPLTLDIFLEEYHQYNLKRDFVQYMEHKIRKRYRISKSPSRPKRITRIPILSSGHSKKIPFPLRTLP